MKLKSTHYVALAFFCIAMTYNEWYKQKYGLIEKFTTTTSKPFDISSWMMNFQRATQNTPGSTPYDQWIGYLYKNPATSSKALNDFKSRVFVPSCKFQRDWNTVLPKGMGRPMAASDATNANIAYKSYLDCLARSDLKCINQLNNALARFMEPGCRFKKPKSPTEYNTNYTPVFV